MGLTIEHLETRQKNWTTLDRRPVLILLQATDPAVTPDLATVFRSEFKYLLPRIYEQAGLPPNAKATWCAKVVGQRVCLTTTDRATFDVYVLIGPEETEDEESV
jgi:hypothetical protein